MAVVEAGTFTDAAITLSTSQASVSRNVGFLEAALGVRLLRRSNRVVELTPAGERALRHARRVLAAVEDLERDAASGSAVVRLGYAWSALGRHTVEFQRRWASAHPEVELQLVRTNSPTAGLREGTSELSILRRAPEAADFVAVLVGTERRYCAMAGDDPLARSKSVALAQVADRAVVIDSRTGSTGLELWPSGTQPRVIDTHDVDDWLTVIGSGVGRGITAEATVHQYRRPGVVYRQVRDAPPVPVYLAWARTDPPAHRREVLDLLAGLYA